MSPRTKFVLIFLLFSIPFAGSTLVFFFWRPAATSNYGQLLSPIISLPDAKFTVIDAGAASKEDLEKSMHGKWLLLIRDGGACESACQKKLYAMRQSRLILGREQDRLLRVVLVDDEEIPSKSLRELHRGTVWISAKTHPWLKMLPTTTNGVGGDRADIFGVDPLGNVFIRYGADPDIKRMSRDFQRLLKASQIG